MILVRVSDREKQIARMLDINLTYEDWKAFVQAEDSIECRLFSEKLRQCIPENDCLARPYKSLMRKLAVASYVTI